jgi:putative redox protein
MVNVLAHLDRKHYATNIRTAANHIVADEPINLGGENGGFSPDELLAASLASCTSITLRMYADRKEWPMEEVTVEVFFDRDEATKEAKMIRRIHFLGKLDDEQKARLLAIADKCPIHKTLSPAINIYTSQV